MFGSRRATYAPFLMEGFADSIKSIAPYAGPAMTVAGSVMSSQQNRAYGRQEREAAEFKAAQLAQDAGQQQAASQRAANEERRKARLAQSRALAVAAASGGGSDPGVLDIISDLASEGQYRALTDVYQGDEAARKLRMGAAGARYQGEATENLYRSAADQSLLRGGMSLFTKYSAKSKTTPATSYIDAGTPAWSPLA